MPSKKPEHQTFADARAEETQRHEPAPQPERINSLVNEKEICDDKGVRWKSRGGTLNANAIAHMIRDPTLTVLHEYGGALAEVAPDDRQAFWAEAEDRMRATQHTEIYGQEFKNEDRQHLIVITETC